MRLEYLPNANLYEEGDAIVRLFDFDEQEAEKLLQLIQTEIILGKRESQLDEVVFITPMNCTLKLIIGEEDIGIRLIDDNHYVCCLTSKSYEQMAIIVHRFTIPGPGSFDWLYDIGSEESKIEFLLSCGGGW